MNLRILSVFVIILRPWNCRAQKPSEAAAQSPPAVCTPSADDAAIYSAAFNKVILKDRDDRRQVVLLSRTSNSYPPGMAVFTSSETPERKELLDAAATATKIDFDAKTKLMCDLAANAGLGASVVFVSVNERDEIFSKNTDPWKDFTKKYPNAAGFTIVSAIGLNGAHNQALIYVGNSCGMLCGSGYLVLLEKKKDKWIAAKATKIWFSS